MTGLGIGSFVVGFALNAGPRGDFPMVANPHGIDTPVVRVVGVAAALVVGVCMVASAISVIVRARRAGRVERQQIKWLAYGGAVVVGTPSGTPSPLKADLRCRKAPAASGVRGLPKRAQPPLPDLLALEAIGERGHAPECWSGRRSVGCGGASAG